MLPNVPLCKKECVWCHMLYRWRGVKWVPRVGQGWLCALDSVLWEWAYGRPQVLQSFPSCLYELCFDLRFSLFSAALFRACRHHPRVSQWPSKSVFHSWDICKLHVWARLLSHWGSNHLLHTIRNLEPSSSSLSRCVFVAELRKDI